MSSVAPELMPLLQAAYTLPTDELCDIITRLSLLNVDVNPEPLVQGIMEAEDNFRNIRFQRAAITLIGDHVQRGTTILRQCLRSLGTTCCTVEDLESDAESSLADTPSASQADSQEHQVENTDIVPLNIYDSVKKSVGTIEVREILGDIGVLTCENIQDKVKVRHNFLIRTHRTLSV